MTVENADAQKLGDGLVRLFQEYGLKLEKIFRQIGTQKKLIKEKGGNWQTSLERMRLERRFEPLRSALFSATREASQLAEQGAVGELGRIELRIRLAELEGLINNIIIEFNQP